MNRRLTRPQQVIITWGSAWRIGFASAMWYVIIGIGVWIILMILGLGLGLFAAAAGG